MHSKKRGRSVVEPFESRLLLSKTIYVDINAPVPGTHDGTSWAAAYFDLRTALDAAQSGDEIRIGDGTYAPEYDYSPHYYRLTSGVAVVGSFAGYGAADPNSRGIITTPTILSGDTGVIGDPFDNVLTIMYGSDLQSGTTLDGIIFADAGFPTTLDTIAAAPLSLSSSIVSIRDCTFTRNVGEGAGGVTLAGYSVASFSNCTFSANISNAKAQGAGAAYITDQASASFTQCRFTNNTADGCAGAIDMSSTGTITLADCAFTNNRAKIAAVDISQSVASATISRCLFLDNASSGGGWIGGGLAVSGGTTKTLLLTLADCTFNGNSTTSFGGGVALSGVEHGSITNCAFTGNSADKGGGGLYFWDSDGLTVSKCTFERNSTAMDGGGIHAYISSPIIDSCTFISNTAAGNGGGVYGERSSMQVTNSAFRQNSAKFGGASFQTADSSTSLTSLPKFINCLFVANSAVVGGGATENWSCSPAFTNCTIVGNRAGRLAGNAVHSINTPSVQITNCIIWDHLHTPFDAVNLSVSYSDIEFGYVGPGNLAIAPEFVDADGQDDVLGTEDDDFRLEPFSALVDAGKNTDPNLASVAVDFYGLPRYRNVPTQPDTGVTGGAGGNAIVDMGASEAQPALSVRINSPTHIYGGATLALSALASSDIAGALTFAWDLNHDGRYDDAIGSSAFFSTTRRAGWQKYPISVRAIDSQNRSVFASSTVLVVPPVLYVDDSAPSGGDGGDWRSAYADLKSALANAVPGSQIRVAQGIYKPSTTDRLDSFKIGGGISIYGGYAGYGAPDPDARSVSSFKTVFSGDIGVAGDASDNSYHVLFIGFSNLPITIDGLAIQDGNASSGYADIGGGGGAYIVQASVEFKNCEFLKNTANLAGGAVYANNASLQFVACTLSGNSATSTGGGIYAVDCAVLLSDSIFASNTGRNSGALSMHVLTPSIESLVITRCTFTSNSSIDAAVACSFGGTARVEDTYFIRNTGGALYLGYMNETVSRCRFNGNTGGTAVVLSGTSTLDDCTFTGNSSSGDGGALRLLGGQTVSNSTFVSNAATTSGGAIYSSGSVSLSNCVVWNNTAASGPQIYVATGGTVAVVGSDVQGGWPGSGNIDVDPQFVRNPAAGLDGKWGTADDDYGDLHLKSSSPAIEAGSNAAVPPGVVNDLDDNPRIVDVPGQNDPGAIVDIGAYEYSPSFAASGGGYLFDGISPAIGMTFIAQVDAGTAAPTDLILLNLETHQFVDTASQVAVTYDNAIRTVSWSFADRLSDGNYRASLPAGALKDAFGRSLSAGYTFDFFVFGGDANHDRVVDQQDLGAVSLHWNQQSGATFSQGDFNYDGRVDVGDLLILSKNWQKTLAAPGPAPAAPASLQALLSGTQINLTWVDQSNNETGFVIERKTGSDGTWANLAQVTAGVQAYPDTTVIGGNTYYYRIYAISADNRSDYSNEASADVPWPIPTAPSGLAAALSGTQVNLTWVDQSSNETGFVIERKTGAAGTWSQLAQVGAGVQTYSDTTVAAGFTYYYRVYAINHDRNSSYSNEASVAYPTPVVTTYLSDLTWTSMTNGWGPAEKDHSNGEQGASDGRTIALNGVTYTRGLGVHASSDISYALNGSYSQFLCDIGVDDEVGSAGSVVFQVYLDGVLSFTSGTMTGTSTTQQVNLGVSGKQTLRLVVSDGGNGNASDHADWAGARLLAGGTAAAAPVPIVGAPVLPAGPVAPPLLAPPPRRGKVSPPSAPVAAVTTIQSPQPIAQLTATPPIAPLAPPRRSPPARMVQQVIS